MCSTSLDPLQRFLDVPTASSTVFDRFRSSTILDVSSTPRSKNIKFLWWQFAKNKANTKINSRKQRKHMNNVLWMTLFGHTPTTHFILFTFFECNFRASSDTHLPLSLLVMAPSAQKHQHTVLNKLFGTIRTYFLIFSRFVGRIRTPCICRAFLTKSDINFFRPGDR